MSLLIVMFNKWQELCTFSVFQNELKKASKSCEMAVIE